MFQFELLDFLRKKLDCKNIFVGPCDQLPTKFTLPAAFIINLSPSNHEGSHWVAIFINKYGEGTYFCSFAMKPTVKSIQHFLRMHCKSVIYNTMQLQATKSTFCGEYAAMFLLSASEGISLDQFLKHFSSNLVLNDMLIRKLFLRSQTFSH